MEGHTIVGRSRTIPPNSVVQFIVPVQHCLASPPSNNGGNICLSGQVDYLNVKKSIGSAIHQSENSQITSRIKTKQYK